MNGNLLGPKFAINLLPVRKLRQHRPNPGAIAPWKLLITRPMVWMWGSTDDDSLSEVGEADIALGAALEGISW